METKTGKGNQSNSSTWTVHYDEKTDKYTASVILATHAGHWFRLYEINKDIFERVGTFNEDDYISEKLIKDNGRLLFEDSQDKYSGYPNIQVKDTKYRTICGWAFKDDEDYILSYVPDAEDKALAELAGTIFKAYNGSYKPNIIPKADIFNECGYWDIKHVRNKFSLIYTYTERGNHEQTVYYTTERINELIPAIFLLIAHAGIKVEWGDIAKSQAVQKALNNKYDTESLTVRYYEFHPALGEVLVCSEFINGKWEDSYYNFYKTNGTSLTKQFKAR